MIEGKGWEGKGEGGREWAWHVVIHEAGGRNKPIYKHRIPELHETWSMKDDAPICSIILGRNHLGAGMVRAREECVGRVEQRQNRILGGVCC